LSDPDFVFPEENTDEVSVRVIVARARASAIHWGFGTLAATILIGIGAFIALDCSRLETSTLREWLQTTIAGEIGLIAGLMSDRDRSV
jgi:hypothetical protein